MKCLAVILFFLTGILAAQNPFLQIHNLLEKEQYSGCEKTLDSCESKNYQIDSVLFYKGLTAIKSGNLEKCRIQCKVLAKKYPAFGEVHYLKGLMFFLEEKYGKSADEFTKALRQNPGDIRALFDRSLALGMMEDYQDALKDLTSCLKLNPQFVKGYYSRAYWHEFLSNYSDAAADYEQTIKLDPENHDAYFGLAYSYRMLKNDAKACDAINRAIQHGSQIAVDLKANFCRDHH